MPLVYIASEQSDWLNGQIVGASGYELQLFNKPAVIRQVRGTERWSTEGAGPADGRTVQAGRRRRRALRLDKLGTQPSPPSFQRKLESRLRRAGQRNRTRFPAKLGMAELRKGTNIMGMLDNRVAIVTGAGRGIGSEGCAAVCGQRRERGRERPGVARSTAAAAKLARPTTPLRRSATRAATRSPTTPRSPTTTARRALSSRRWTSTAGSTSWSTWPATCATGWSST